MSIAGKRGIKVELRSDELSYRAEAKLRFVRRDIPNRRVVFEFMPTEVWMENNAFRDILDKHNKVIFYDRFTNEDRDTFTKLSSFKVYGLTGEWSMGDQVRSRFIYGGTHTYDPTSRKDFNKAKEKFQSSATGADSEFWNLIKHKINASHAKVKKAVLDKVKEWEANPSNDEMRPMLQTKYHGSDALYEPSKVKKYLFEGNGIEVREVPNVVGIKTDETDTLIQLPPFYTRNSYGLTGKTRSVVLSCGVEPYLYMIIMTVSTKKVAGFTLTSIPSVYGVALNDNGRLIAKEMEVSPEAEEDQFELAISMMVGAS